MEDVSENRYTAALVELLEGKLTMNYFAQELLGSDNLETDVGLLFSAIEMNDNWKELASLSALHDFLKTVQREILFQFPVEEPVSENLYPYVCFANLYVTGGKAIAKNHERALELLLWAKESAPDYAFALGSLACLYLELNLDLKAHDLFVEAIQLDPDYTFALIKLGELLRKGGHGVEQDASGAYHYLHRAVMLDPKSTYALSALGELLRRGGDHFPSDPKRAYFYLQSAHDLDAHDPSVLVSLAELLHSRANGVPFDPQRAYMFYEVAQKLVPDDQFILTRRAQMLVSREHGVPHHPREAAELFERVIALNPQYPPALAHYAELLRLGDGEVAADLDRARMLCERSLEEDPEYPFALATLGQIVKVGSEKYRENPKAAIGLFEQAISLDAEYEFPQACLGELYWVGAEGVPSDEKKAHQYFERALAINPHSTFSCNYLGEILRVGGNGIARDPKRAYTLLEHSLKLNPDQPFAITTLASLLLYSDDFPQDHKRAYALYERAYALEPTRPATLVGLGGILKDGVEGVEKDEKRAFNLLSEAENYLPDNLFVLCHLAELYLKNKDLYNVNEAYSRLKKAVSFDPPFAYPFIFLAELLLSKLPHIPDREKEAFALLEQALQKEPGSVQAMFLMSLLLKPHDALAAFRFMERAAELDPQNPTFKKARDELFQLTVNIPSLDNAFAQELFNLTLDSPLAFDPILQKALASGLISFPKLRLFQRVPAPS